MKTAASLIAAVAFAVTSFGVSAAPLSGETSMTRSHGVQFDAKAKKSTKKKAPKQKAAATK